MTSSKVKLFFSEDADIQYVETLKKTFDTITEDCITGPSAPELYLRLSSDGLSLVGKECVLQADFSADIKRLRHNNLTHELLIKAAKSKNAVDSPTVIDATAGLGEDSLLLAAAGYNVILYERDPVIAALLRDALKRAGRHPELSCFVSRMTLHEKDSITAMTKLNAPPDAVYLDPMFPKRRKSALIKKKFQMIQMLEAPCSDENELLNAALKSGAKKIIIKRPADAPYLGGQKPSYSIKGSTIRYDCIIPHQQ